MWRQQNVFIEGMIQFFDNLTLCIIMQARWWLRSRKDMKCFKVSVHMNSILMLISSLELWLPTTKISLGLKWHISHDLVTILGSPLFICILVYVVCAWLLSRRNVCCEKQQPLCQLSQSKIPNGNSSSFQPVVRLVLQIGDSFVLLWLAGNRKELLNEWNMSWVLNHWPLALDKTFDSEPVTV